MASYMWESIFLTFLFIFSVRVLQHNCMTLEQSGFPAFAVDSCPGNMSEVEAGTLRLNCSDVKEFRNVYHCLPLSNLSLLVEFCYDRISGLIEKGNCMVLENQYLNNHPCNHFTNGCPDVPYLAKNMFSFPACIQINKQNSCYLAEPSCPNISIVEGTTLPTVNAMGNNTDLTNDLSQVIIGVLSPFFSIGLVILIMWNRERHRRFRRGRKGKKATEFEETSPLVTNEDNTTNEKQTYLEDEDFWERYQKYLDEGSVEVCPISQIIILGEHGVGKTTLLYRLQGRSREEIEAIRPTRGVECHQEQHSFIITQSQLKMNTKGISSLSADPELISGFSAETQIDENEIAEWAIPESHDQPALTNAEAQATKTEYVEGNRSRDIHLDESKERKMSGRVNTASKENVDIHDSTGVLPDHSREADHYGKPKYDIQSNQDIQPEHDRQPEHHKELDYNTQSLVTMIKAELENQTSQFGNKNDVVLDVLDFAGQGEYYASHQTYIRKDAIFILVVDTSKDMNHRKEKVQSGENKNQFLCDKPGVAFACWSPKDYVHYWLNTIRMHGGNSESIIFVGTHEDQKRKDFDFHILLRETINGKHRPKKYATVITDLNRYDEGSQNDITKIKNVICNLIDKSGRESQPAKWVKYSNRFDIIKRKCPIVKIEELLEMNDHFDFRMSDTEIADMLGSFHSSGKIIFFNVDKLQEILILDIQWFIDCFKHIICDRKHVVEDIWFIDEEEEMLNNFHEKGVLDVRLYEKLLSQKRVPKQYWKILGEFQNKLGMMFFIKNHKINADVTIEEGWYVPSINTQEFKPSSTKYESKDSSQILCFRFINYLPYDLFGRVIVACVNSGNWHPYDFLLCKTGVNMCYRHSSMDKGEQIYLFTSNRIVTVQFIGKHSGKNGQTVRQEINNIIRQFCHFYASSTEYEVGFLCCKKEGYKENSVNHFVSEKDKFCQGCKSTCHDEWKDAESFWKEESKEEHPISTRRKPDPLQIACDVYFHVVKQSTEMAAIPPEGVSRETDSTWLDNLVKIGQKLKNLHRNIGGLDEKKDFELRNIKRDLKNVSCGLGRDFRKEIFFLWTQETYKGNQGIPVVSFERSEEAQDSTEITIEAKADAEILHYLWFRKTFHKNRYRVLNPSEEKEGRCEFQKKGNRLALKLKEFDLEDEGMYYAVVETKNGFTISRGIVESSADGFSILTGDEVSMLFCFMCSDSGPPDFTDTGWLDMLNEIRQRVHYEEDPVTSEEAQQTLDRLKSHDFLWLDRTREHLTADAQDEIMYRVSKRAFDIYVVYYFSSFIRAQRYLRSGGYNRKPGEKCVTGNYDCDSLVVRRLQMDILTHVTMEDTGIFAKVSQILNIPLNIVEGIEKERQEFHDKLKEMGESVHYRGRSQDSVQHVRWLWRYEDKARPDIVRSCIGLHPHWDIYIINNKAYKKTSRYHTHPPGVRCHLYCLLLVDHYTLDVNEPPHGTLLSKLRERYFTDLLSFDDKSLSHVPEGITDKQGSKLKFKSDDIRHDVMYAFVTECLVDDSDLEFFLTTGSRDVISEYCRSWQYEKREGERCLYVPDLPKKMYYLFIDKLQLDIITHRTVSDWKFRDRIHERLGVPEEVLGWDLEARKRYVEYAKRGTQTVHHARGMIVGCAGAGKTTLLRRLMGCTEEELRNVKSTEGLEVHEEIFQIEDETNTLKAFILNEGEKKGESFNKRQTAKTLSLFDFGGQCAYYACHQIYLTRRAFYVVVVDASKRLDQMVDKAVCDQEGSVFSGWTYGDYFVFWLKSIHTYCSAENKEDQKPIVLIVATHWDVKNKQYKDKYDFMENLLRQLPSGSHLLQYIKEDNCYCIQFPVPLHDLENRIADIARHLRWTEKIPKEWVIFDIHLQQTKEKILETSSIQVEINATENDDVLVESQNDKTMRKQDMLRFYHDAGKVLYFNEDGLRESFITNVQWFVDAFKNIITDKLHLKGIDVTYKDWKEYYHTGNLRDELLVKIWKHKERYQVLGRKEEVLHFMQRLGLLAIGKESHYIPCMNRKEMEEEIQIKFLQSKSKSSVLVYQFDVLPFFFFFRLVVASMLEKGWHVLQSHGISHLYRNAALFAFEQYNILLSVTADSIQLQVLHSVSGQPLEEEKTRHIQATIERLLVAITETFHRKLIFGRGIRCQEDEGKPFAMPIQGYLLDDKNTKWEDKNDQVCLLHRITDPHFINTFELKKYWTF